MKEAMWRVDKTGTFQFSDATNPNQTMLFENGPNYAQLKKILLKEFKGKSVNVADLENFIITQTPFRETHYKTHILREMEKANPPEVNITCSIQRRKGNFTPTCIVEFL